MSFTIGDFKQEAEVFIARGEAKKIKKYLGTGGYITHYDKMGLTPIKDVDMFIIVIYHDIYKEGVAKITKKDDIQWRDVLIK